MNFNKEIIMSLVTDNNIFILGEALYNLNKERILKVMISEVMSYKKFICNISDDDKEYEVTITVKENIISSYTCFCNKGSIFKNICKHIICVLLILLDKNEDEIISVDNEEYVEDILNVFKRDLYRKGLSSEEIYLEDKIKISPTIYIEDDKAYLSLKIGTFKMHSILNIEEFLLNIKRNKEFTYGRYFVPSHDINLFDSRSKMLVKYIEENINLNNLLKKSFDLNDSLGFLEDRILLLTDLENFYNIYLNDTFNMVFDSRNIFTIKILEDKININLKLYITDEKAQIVCKERILYEWEGKTSCYLVLKNNPEIMYRVEPSYHKSLKWLISFFEEKNINTLYFEKEYLNEFKNIILPKLIRLDLIEASEEVIEKYVPKLKIEFYLDFEGDSLQGKITLEMFFLYGGLKVNPLKDRLTNIRDIELEEDIFISLEEYKFCKVIDKFELSSQDDIYDFLMYGINELKDKGIVYVSDTFKLKKRPSIENLNVRIKLINNLLELKINDTEYSIKELIEIVDNYNESKKYYRLKDGSYVPLTQEIMNLKDLFIKIKIDESNIVENKIELPKYKIIYIDSILKNKTLNYTTNDIYKKIIYDLKNYEKLEYKVPESLKIQLRDYQINGYKWLKMLSENGFGGILADDMGLGKTVQIIALLESEVDNFLNSSIVVCPTSLVYNWGNEINKFSYKLKVKIIEGDALTRKETLNKFAHIYITTYDTLKRDIKNYSEKKFKYVISDEAQYIKNYKTQNAKIIKMLNSDIRLALTGTPIENSLIEIWSILDFVMPNYLGSVKNFIQTYEKEETEIEEDKKILKKQISMFILRRLKKDVLKDLPEKIETILYAELKKMQKQIYTAYLYDARGKLKNDISKIKMLSLLTRLRQICAHPKLFKEDFKGGSGKLDLTLQIIKDYIIAGHRILLFSQFSKMLNILKEELKSINIEYFHIDGTTGTKDRIDSVNRFNSGERKIFLISLKAGGVGLNLTSADVVIHYDQWWNPFVMSQATDRAYRYGQDKVVNVINIIVKDTIEEKILELQNKKIELVNSIMNLEEDILKNITEDDIKNIFY